MLSHTSGYEDYAPQDYLIPEWTKPTTPEAILDRWANRPLNFDPGTRWQSAIRTMFRSYEEFTHAVKLKNGKPTHYALGLQTGEMAGTPMRTHSGEVSGFLSMDSVFPGKNLGIAVLLNEDGVDLISAVMRETVSLLLQPPEVDEERQEAAVRKIVTDLRTGQIDPALFTGNANSYFIETTLSDYRTSLQSLG